MLPFARTNSPGTYPVLSALTFPSMGPLAQQQQQSVLLSLIVDAYCKAEQGFAWRHLPNIKTL